MSWRNLWRHYFFKATFLFCSHVGKIYVISCLLRNFLSFYVKEMEFAVILSDKWVIKNKVSTLLHYSFWRNGQGQLSIILNCKWFFSKSSHCQCLKITFKLLSWLSSAMVHHTNTPLLEKIKLNMVSSMWLY